MPRLNPLPKSDPAFSLPALPPDWAARIPDFSSQQKKLESFLAEGPFFPPPALVFSALEKTGFHQTKVVILGQDPYHGPGQAHGLSFSVPDGVPLPPSLKNIYKEISREYGVPQPVNGDLSRWAEQGVLLLNAVLTVQEGEAGSHQNRGWEPFTDAVISLLSRERQNLVFLLWGAHAQKKGLMIDRAAHLVLEAPHPSPLSAHRGFIGCGHFRKANDYLSAHGHSPIRWA